jgi:hypothetical protein
VDALILSALSSAGDRGSQVLRATQTALGTRGHDAETVDVIAAHVGPCRGCGNCGLHTPGRCTQDDDMQTILPRVVRTDLLVLASPVRFGSHCYPMKLVIERSMPLNGPVFVIRDGEMHHRPRYPRRPALLGVGLLDPGGPAGEGDAYRALFDRHAVNLASPAHASIVISPEEGASVAAELLVPALEAVEPAVADRTSLRDRR